jgi:hypothetical protein
MVKSSFSVNLGVLIMAVDLSKATVEELMHIKNEVLRNVAIRTKVELEGGLRASAHDSHSSSHSNNKIADLTAHIDEVFQRARQQP